MNNHRNITSNITYLHIVEHHLKTELLHLLSWYQNSGSAGVSVDARYSTPIGARDVQDLQGVTSSLSLIIRYSCFFGSLRKCDAILCSRSS